MAPASSAAKPAWARVASAVEVAVPTRAGDQGNPSGRAPVGPLFRRSRRSRRDAMLPLTERMSPCLILLPSSPCRPSGLPRN